MKKCVWRLKEQPTAKSIQDLVSSGILTKEEARQMLFSSQTEEDRDKKSLESEIKFLRELVEKLSQRSQIVSTIKEIEVPYKQYPWFEPYTTWYNNGFNGTIMRYTTGGTSTTSNILFSDITTF